MASEPSGIDFGRDLGSLKVRNATLVPKINTAIGVLFQSQAGRVQDYARANAKWTDQTGNARQGLFARYSKSGDGHQIDLYHTVNYGIWLEVRWAGRYAIIVPTINAEGRRIMGMLRNMLGKMGAL